jgi:hypothetical protein
VNNTNHGDPYVFHTGDNPVTAGVRASSIFRSILATFVIAFSFFAWVAFATVPPPNPWMMGEVAFTRILIMYGVILGGSLIVCVSAPIADWKLKLKIFRWLALPCAALLIVLVVRGLLGYPLSMG